MSLPDKKITLSFPYLIAFLTLLVSMSVGYGGYKAGYENQQKEVHELQMRVDKLTDALNSTSNSVAALTAKLDFIVSRK